MKPGTIVWVDLDPTRGHEQRGHRPALVVSGEMRRTALVVPLTSTPPRTVTHHRMTGERMSVALCEQLRMIDLERVTGVSGAADPEDVQAVRHLIARLIGVRPR